MNRRWRDITRMVEAEGLTIADHRQGGGHFVLTLALGGEPLAVKLTLGCSPSCPRADVSARATLRRIKREALA